MAGKRIGIDGFNLGMAKGSGIATYARNLNLAVRGLGHQSQILLNANRGRAKFRILDEVALVDAGPVGASRLNPGALPWLGRRAHPVTMTGEVITRQFDARLPPADRYFAGRNLFGAANRNFSAVRAITPVKLGSGRETDIMHWTCPLPMTARGAANLYTIHDLVPLRLPYATLENKAVFFALCRWIARRADHIVTVSEHSRQDIVRLLKVPEHRVTSTLQAVEIPARFRDQPEIEAARTIEGMFGLDWRGYFLFFGAIEPKKNLARVVEAYLASGVEAPLVIIGGRAWLDEHETRLIYGDLVQAQSLKDGVIRRRDRIRRYEYLPFNLLVSLIRGARATLFPSLYEGFGLPVLESMMLGTPVLTSSAGSLPEIAGDAALRVDCYDVDAIKRGIQSLDGDEGLRDDLSRRGVLQAAHFSGEAYRERLAALYAKLG